MSPLDKVIDLCGGVGKLAAAIGISQSAVSNWRARGTSPEPVNCVAIEQATDAPSPAGPAPVRLAQNLA